MKIHAVLTALLLIPKINHNQRSISSYPTDAAVICWQERCKLTWNDFQAEKMPMVPEADTLLGAFVEAVTDSNAVIYDWTTNTGDYVKTTVRVEFYRKKSWVNKVNKFNKTLTLKHEQLHFDITELTGRKIRQVLVGCAAQHVNYHTLAITQKITHIYNEESSLTTRYDQATGDGDNTQAQVRWQAFINKQLYVLEAYKSTPTDCELPR